MKKNLLHSFFLMIMVSFLGLVSCEKIENQGNEDGNGGNGDSQTFTPKQAFILSNCDSKLDYNKGLGLGKPTDFKAITKFTAEQLSKAGSKTISRLRIGLVAEATNLVAFIRESKDGQNLCEATFTYFPSGWSTAKFDKPFEIPEGKDLYIGYSLTSSGYSIGFNGRKRSEDAIWVDGSWLTLPSQNILGSLTIQAILEGGDYSNEEPQYDLALSTVNMPADITSATPFEASAVVCNEGINSINKFSVEGVYNGQTFSKEVTGINLGTGEYIEFPLGNFTSSSEPGETTMRVTVKNDDFEDHSMINNTITKQHNVYIGGFKRSKVLIEQFTGQGCPNCPGGAKALTNAIKKMKDPSKICWVAHHTYYTDDFSLTESATIARYLRVNAAPMAVINRTKQQYTNKSELVVHPAGISTDLLNKLAERETSASIKIDHQFNKDTRELKVTVSGETKISDIKMTVILTQSGMKAQQAGAGNDYQHNFAPRAFLSEAMGDKVTVKDGKYTKEYTFKVPERVGKHDVDLTKVNIAAFIAIDGNSVSKTPVLNADEAPLLK